MSVPQRPPESVIGGDQNAGGIPQTRLLELASKLAHRAVHEREIIVVRSLAAERKILTLAIVDRKQMGSRKVDVEKIDLTVGGVPVCVVADREVLLLLAPLQGRIFQLFCNGVGIGAKNIVEIDR